MQVQIASQERNWAMAAHLSALIAIAGLPFGHVVGPLVVYLIKAHESEFVAEHARASLNYQITVSIVGVVGVIAAVATMLGFIASGSAQQMSDTGTGLSFVVFWIAVAIAVLLVLLLSLIFIIAGTVAASQGRPYTYPFAIRFLR
ncbi:MAG: DUF4870 domain-containing protein [Candidatus Cybelea sp.]|jgi:uncharacterized Tic20 family protein